MVRLPVGNGLLNCLRHRPENARPRRGSSCAGVGRLDDERRPPPIATCGSVSATSCRRMAAKPISSRALRSFRRSCKARSTASTATTPGSSKLGTRTRKSFSAPPHRSSSSCAVDLALVFARPRERVRRLAFLVGAREVGAQMGRILEKLRNLGRVEKEGSRRRWTHRAFSVERAAAVRRTRRRRSNAQSVHAVCPPGSVSGH